MKANLLKRNKKLIAKVYTESQQDKFKRRHLLYLLSMMGGLVFSLQATESHAASAPANINLDVINGQVDVDYNQVDKFTQAQDTMASRFAALDRHTLILSNKPIKIVKVARAYQPRSLGDLGVKVNVISNGVGDSIVRIPTYTVMADNVNSTPAVPEGIVISAAAPNAMRQEAVPTTPAASVSSSSTSPSPAQPIIATNSVKSENRMFWDIFFGAAFAVGSLLFLSQYRRTTTTKSENSIYSGSPEMNHMVGKGKLFDFNGNVLKGRVTPINTTYLNMLWHVGKFSKEGSMNTYFYMAFYIPPQQDYAKTLQNTTKAKETHTEE